jgi:outer membrane cobalamin receptor
LTNITVRIPDELRTRMRGLSEINWSEVVRKAIEGRIDLETRRRRDRESISEAGRRVDAIFEKLRAEHGAIKFDSSETIRYWRNHRYGATS